MATTDRLLRKFGTSAFVAGLFCSLALLGCQATTPQEVTTSFWMALAQGQADVARQKATPNSQQFVKVDAIDQHSPIKIGEILIDETNASVETTITRSNKQITFNTVLLKGEAGWQVDYQQTNTNIAMIPFEGIAKSLQQIGDTLTQQLEQSVPLIEKEIESIGNDLKDQIDEFGRHLNTQPSSPKQSSKQNGSI